MGIHYLSALVAVMVLVNRVPGQTIDFAGYTWNVKHGDELPPQSNSWRESNVWVDTMGRLNLRIRREEDGKWTCAEVSSTVLFPFGSYRFSVIGRIDRFDPNVILGLFHYLPPDEANELDIEFGQFGHSDWKRGTYSVFPNAANAPQPTPGDGQYKFDVALEGFYTTHRYRWSPTNVDFKSWYGHGHDENNAFGAAVFSPSNPEERVPQKPMPLHMNLWLFGADPPSDRREIVITIADFEYEPGIVGWVQDWRSGPGRFRWERAKLVCGDVNGDGMDDVVALYGYSGDDTAVFVAPGSTLGLGDGFDPSRPVYRSGLGNFSWARSKPVCGDMDGDGFEDLVVLYDYQDEDTGILVFRGAADGLRSSFEQLWRSGPGNFAWDRAMPAIGDVDGDGLDDVVTLYDYGGATTAIFVFRGADGLEGFVEPWRSDSGAFRAGHTKPLVGDVDEDGFDDLVALYNYGSADTAVHVFHGSSEGLRPYAQHWRSGSGRFAWERAKPLIGNLDGEGSEDLVVLYDYGEGDSAVFAFEGSSNGLRGGYRLLWRSGSGRFTWEHAAPVFGNFWGARRGSHELAALYRYGSADTALHVFR